MLGFRRYITLFENRLDYIKRTMPTINSSHDSNAQHRDTSRIVDHFATKADPSKTSQYTQWIVNKYHKGDFRQEDHPRIKEALENFDLHKSKLEHKDINRYKSLHDLETAVQPHIGTGPEISDTAREKELKEKGATLVHSANGLTVHRLNDMNGAMIYGRGTKWCTSSTKATVTEPNTGEDGISRPTRREGTIIQHTPKDYPVRTSMSPDGIRMDGRFHIKMKDTGKVEEHPSSVVSHDNMFHEYHNQGHMYVIHTPDGEKYQHHPASGQFMDKQDREADIPALVKTHPELKNVKEFKDTNHLLLDKEEFKDKAAHFINNTDLNFGSTEMGSNKNHIFNSPYLTPEHVDLITNRIAKETSNGWDGAKTGASIMNLANSKALKMMSPKQKQKISDAIDKIDVNPDNEWYTNSLKDLNKLYLK